MNNLNSRVIKIEKIIERTDAGETLEGQLQAFSDGKFGTGCMMSLVVAFMKMGEQSLIDFPEPLKGFFVSAFTKKKRQTVAENGTV